MTRSNSNNIAKSSPGSGRGDSTELDVSSDCKFQSTHIGSEAVIFALQNINEELKKLRSDEHMVPVLDREKVKELGMVYQDLVRLLAKHPSFKAHDVREKINLFHPLMKLISLNLAFGDFKAANALVDVFSGLIWYHLNHPMLFTNLIEMFTEENGLLMRSFCEQIIKMIPSRKECPSSFDYWYSRKVNPECSDDVRNMQQIFSIGYLASTSTRLTELHGTITQLESVSSIRTLEQKDNKFLLHVLTSLTGYTNNSNGRELLTLVGKNMGLNATLKAIKPKNVWPANMKLIKFLEETISWTMNWVDPAISCDSRQFQSYKRKDPVLTAPESRSPEKVAFLFLLELLDHSSSMDTVHTTNLINQLNMSLKLLTNCFQNDKAVFYSQYNELNCKPSVSTILSSIIFLLSSQLSKAYYDYDAPPNIISSHFEHLKLPPLAKSNFFSIITEEKETRSHIDHFKGQLQFEKCTYCLFLCVNLLNKILKDELYAFSTGKIGGTDTISSKLIFRLVGSTISSLFTALTFLQQNKSNSDYNFVIAREAVIAAYYTLLSTDIKCTSTSLIWVCLINFASDLCFFDLKYVSIFEKLFLNLLERFTPANEIIRSQLVGSALSFFFNTFSSPQVLSNPLLASLSNLVKQDPGDMVTIQYQEYEFIYKNSDKNLPHRKTSGTEQDSILNNSYGIFQKQANSRDSDRQPLKHQFSSLSLNPPSSNREPPLLFDNDLVTSSTPIRSKYITNTARQQSIHVDQYGK
ncbi:Piso0_003526 [Millerozyma farinosa CBS 7064]|uniref:Piso0_003526 protein n=1 Tax=Pichia sorbitophila (strain ATCC MYA-4447 / BCRC 22081 / CBS 7064 / NBRC 10061 / NRRL Y-12695) TaxID=559304 RepID=G8YIC3_PICSO|nr:Piso0_003526 [Millerozyma farinosa CBS 7064]CCE81175.1 Piso0_003526 [Millerozyma farinosa CBS 7064]